MWFCLKHKQCDYSKDIDELEVRRRQLKCTLEDLHTGKGAKAIRELEEGNSLELKDPLVATLVDNLKGLMDDGAKLDDELSKTTTLSPPSEHSSIISYNKRLERMNHQLKFLSSSVQCRLTLIEQKEKEQRKKIKKTYMHI